MSKNLKIGLVVAAVIVLAVVFWPRPAVIDTSVLGDKLTLTRIVLDKQQSNAGVLDVPYKKDTDDYTYANIMVDLNGDGKFTSYQVGELTQPEWVVQNMGVRVLKDEGNTFSIDLPDHQIDSHKDLKAVVVLTKQKIENWDGMIPKPSAGVSYTISEVKIDDISDIYTPDPKRERSGGFPFDMLNPQIVWAAETSRPTQPPLSGEQIAAQAPQAASGEGAAGAAAAPPPAPGPAPAPATPATGIGPFNQGMPDIVQKHNECVPTGTANSLLWLAQKYGFADKIPANSGASVIEQLKTDMRWSTNGVDVRQNYLGGKQRFTNRNHIPITTSQVGATFDGHIGDVIAGELAKGNDVELDIEYGGTDAAGNYVRAGGHMVTVVAVWQAGGQTFIGIHDPGSREEGKLDVYQVDGSRILNYRFRGNYTTYIRYAFAEAPTDEARTAAAAGASVANSFSDFEGRNAQDAWLIDTLKFGEEYYPTFQFHVGHPDVCDADHWHARGEVFGHKLGAFDPRMNSPEFVKNRNAPVVTKTDPNPGSCGYGKVSEVERKQVMISKSEGEALAGAVITK